MTKDYWKALFASPRCGNFILAILCCLVALVTWPLDGWLSVAGGLFSIPTIFFGHRAWADTKCYLLPHETFQPELPRPWLVGILLIGYVRAVLGVLSVTWMTVYPILKDWAVMEHHNPGVTAGVFIILGLSWFIREILCWLVKTNKLLEQQALQLKELQEIKAKMSEQSKAIEAIKAKMSEQSKAIEAIRSVTAQWGQPQQ